jgi:peptidoglycan hydrolase-like protein with peptidoglycan-binding domain
MPTPAPTPAPYSATAGPPASSGPATPQAVEQHLADLRYVVGPIDGNIDDDSASGIMAFQKVNGLPRTGELTGDVAAAIMGASGFPTPLVPNPDVNKVEVDLTRQVLFLYEGGSLSKIIPVSSGKASTPTPTGSYTVIRRAKGWETSDLGRLYNSQYFVGGYAIHGSPSVPNYPASHGCIRIPMSVAEWFPDHVALGTPVYVLGG